MPKRLFDSYACMIYCCVEFSACLRLLFRALLEQTCVAFNFSPCLKTGLRRANKTKQTRIVTNSKFELASRNCSRRTKSRLAFFVTFPRLRSCRVAMRAISRPRNGLCANSFPDAAKPTQRTLEWTKRRLMLRRLAAAFARTQAQQESCKSWRARFFRLLGSQLRAASRANKSVLKQRGCDKIATKQRRLLVCSVCFRRANQYKTERNLQTSDKTSRERSAKVRPLLRLQSSALQMQLPANLRAESCGLQLVCIRSPQLFAVWQILSGAESCAPRKVISEEQKRVARNSITHSV